MPKKPTTDATNHKAVKMTPLVKLLRGSFTAPKNMVYKKELVAALERKHL